MIKIFSTDKVRELDKYTIQNEPYLQVNFAAAIPNKLVLSYLPDKETTEPMRWQSPVC